MCKVNYNLKTEKTEKDIYKLFKSAENIELSREILLMIGNLGCWKLMYKYTYAVIKDSKDI